MMSTANPSRREFFQASAAGTALFAGAVVAPSDGPAAAWAASNAPDEVRLKSWELVDLPGLTMRPDKEGRRLAIRITATNDAVGVMPVRSCKGFSDATAQIVKTDNLHEFRRPWEGDLAREFSEFIQSGGRDERTIAGRLAAIEIGIALLYPDAYDAKPWLSSGQTHVVVTDLGKLGFGLSAHDEQLGTEKKWAKVGDVLDADAARVIVKQLGANPGGNTSVRSQSPLVWKDKGYFQCARDLGQVFPA